MFALYAASLFVVPCLSARWLQPAQERGCREFNLKVQFGRVFWPALEEQKGILRSMGRHPRPPRARSPCPPKHNHNKLQGMPKRLRLRDSPLCVGENFLADPVPTRSSRATRSSSSTLTFNVISPSPPRSLLNFDLSPAPSRYLLRRERDREGEMIDRSLAGALPLPPELEVRHA